MIFSLKRLVTGCVVYSAALVVTGSAAAQAARYADVLGLYDPGNFVGTVDIGFGGTTFDNPDAALGGPGETVTLSGGGNAEFVSLGTYTGGEGLIVGFSDPVPNLAGSDFLVQGNNSFGLHEPGFVEVAVESSGNGGATATGWQDETFYLLRPSNFDQITDPRNGPNPIDYFTQTPGEFDFVYGPGPFQDGSSLTGYVDTAVNAPDFFDLAWAIDTANQAVLLEEIAYVRIRTVTDSAIDYSSIDFGSGPLGLDYFSSEIDFVGVVPEPATGLVIAAGLLGLSRRRTR
ncbi:MAG: PEP-CTERM sorting domain-containing protein [Planctomycetota bacterium]